MRLRIPSFTTTLTVVGLILACAIYIAAHSFPEPPGAIEAGEETRLAFTDTDGDGIYDAEDVCPNSDRRPTVIVDTCNSGVHNQLLLDSARRGCTITDEIALCAKVRNREQFLSCVVQLTHDLKKNGTISEKDEDKIYSCTGMKRYDTFWNDTF